MALFDELISPELALVCPDLRVKAIAALPPPQPWFPSRPRPGHGQLRRAHFETATRSGKTECEDQGVRHAVTAYALARAADLFVIAAAMVTFVLLLAAVAGIART